MGTILYLSFQNPPTPVGDQFCADVSESLALRLHTLNIGENGTVTVHRALSTKLIATIGPQDTSAPVIYARDSLVWVCCMWYSSWTSVPEFL